MNETSDPHRDPIVERVAARKRRRRAAKEAAMAENVTLQQISQFDALVAIQQRQFLMAQVQAAIERQAGEKMASGALTMQGAGAFVQMELNKVQAGLNAIHEQVAATSPDAVPS